MKLMAVSSSALIGAKASRLKRKFPILHLFEVRVMTLMTAKKALAP